MAMCQIQDSSGANMRQTVALEVSLLQHLSGRLSDQGFGNGAIWRQRKVANAKPSPRIVESIASFATEMNRAVIKRVTSVK